MPDRTQFPAFPAIDLADPFRNAIRLGLNLWAQSLEQRWDLCRKVVDTVSNAFAPGGDAQNQLWEVNRDLLRFVADRPFDLERGALTLCQSVAGGTERSRVSQGTSTGTSQSDENRAEPRDPPGRRQGAARTNGAASKPESELAVPLPSEATQPEAKPLRIQTPIGLDHPVVVPISLRNHNDRPSKIRLSATPYVDDRGWLASAPAMRFQPSEVSLPGSGCCEAAGLIDTRAGFEPNRVYRADIVLEGEPTLRIPFYIRTLPTPVRETPGVTADLAGAAGPARPRAAEAESPNARLRLRGNKNG